MINFTVGPVQSPEYVLETGARQVPYFRTSEFSEVMFENEKLMLELSHASTGSRTAFITGSGTAAMEAAVINCFNKNDRVLVIDGGSFGHRFVSILEIHEIPHSVIVPSFASDITEDILKEHEDGAYTGFLVNLDETSVGVLYNIEMISDFCKRHGIFLIVDSISSFLCDPFDMNRLGVDVMITGSQKALACPPGISVIVMNKRAVERINENDPGTLYLDLKPALKDGERGQTPFTPAVGILLQLNERLKHICQSGGAEAECKRVWDLAEYFRSELSRRKLPFRIVSNSLSNAVTPLSPTDGRSARYIFETLKDNYGIWVCPNGGELSEKMFRVGHIGALEKADYDVLLSALKEISYEIK